MIMHKFFHQKTMLPTLLLCFLFTFMTACSSVTANYQAQTPTTPTSATATPTSKTNGQPGNDGGSSGTQPMPQTSTSCPAPNTARAAIMRPLSLGNHQNVVYVYNNVPQNTSTASGILRRYDMTTGQKIDIISSGIRIDQAQVSQDGQWVLFLSVPDPRGDSQHSAMLQLVRMDGQGLQTLYCFPNATYAGQNPARLPISLQWSGDQKSILFSVNTMNGNNVTSQIFVLNVASGSLHQLFLNQNDPLYYYSLVTWLDNTNFYIIKQGTSGPTPPATVFLMNATTATVAHPGLVTMLTTPTRFSFNSFDSSADGSQLYSSYCSAAASPFSSNVSIGPALGGSRTMLLQESPAVCVQVLRVISPSKLLLLVHVINAVGDGYQVWTMNTPGASSSELTALSTSANDPSSYDLNETSQFTWSNISRDGSSYALQAVNGSTNTQSILIGALSGGNPQVVATTNSGASTVSLAGWTTM